MSSDVPFRGEDAGRWVAGKFGVVPAARNAFGPLVGARDLRLRMNADFAGCDVLVTLGSGCGHRLGRRRPSIHATFDDCTVVQSAVPESPAKAAWIERQKRLYESADLCFAASGWAASSIRSDYGIDERKVRVTGFGANVVGRVVEKDWSRPRLLWVGVDWYRKGGDLLLKAFQEASIPGATLDVVGSHPSISEPNVTCHGTVRDASRLRDLFERSTLFVLPSRFEAYGIVFAEAASTGTPLLGTRVGGIPEAIGPGGLTVPAEDVVSLVAALEQMTVPDVAAAYGRMAADHAASQTWKNVAERMVNAVDGVRG
jgi:glycosyltransferase involved in cell wall biosynthesis